MTATSDPVQTPVDNRNIRFSLDPADIDIDQVLILFKRNAFWAQERTDSDMERAFRHSHPVVTVWDGQRMVGFGRATTDTIYRAVLWDVVVDLDYRRLGIGRKLVETLISHPDVEGVERVYLFTTHQQGFYERIGFVENTSTTLVLKGKAIDFVASGHAGALGQMGSTSSGMSQFSV
ncbi:MAG: GNAT family N-acetyltransferase [Synechococcaceae cyanobacterium SM2_3_2]|nr:GNAT family N-acetyltransferase [Synechococcaceae cyanobacterium SM2_3_2]